MRRGTGFNGATAMKPWKRQPGPGTPGADSGFNGATAMKPWKRAPPGSFSKRVPALQWGHGDEAVEERMANLIMLSSVGASMGPRR